MTITATTTKSEATTRTWVALGLAEALFAVVYPVAAMLAMRASQPVGFEGEPPLIAFLVLTGGFCVVVAIPVAVHTVGRYTARVTSERSMFVAAAAHLIVGCGLGVLAAAIGVTLGPIEIPAGSVSYILGHSIELPAAALALVLPAGTVALGTSLLMPLALRHEWIRIASWVVTGFPLAFTVLILLSATLGSP